jgi:hypothetical protein
MPTQPKHDSSQRQIVPDSVPLNALQAQRLASLTGIESEQLIKKSIADITEQFKWRIDPELLLFKRICGRVVKKDPSSGIDYPVPFATVHIEDTDCSFLGFFPVEQPWSWLFPIFCHREELATVKTDACGHFCVWIPRFEIDWILRWRRERICFPELLAKPSIRDILGYLQQDPNRVHPHGPDPDPTPFITPSVLQRTESLLGRTISQQLSTASHATALTGKTNAFQSLLDQPAHVGIQPPISPKLRQLFLEYTSSDKSTLAERLGAHPERVGNLNTERFVGPFLRWKCHYEWRSELVPILDVPDITFRVTQDVNGDGIEETIYSESYFDVRWNAGTIPDVTLHANALAVASPSCVPLPDPQCDALGNGVGIASAGFLPLTPIAPLSPTNPPSVGQYIDPNTGYGIRPNRPHLDALIRTSTLADQSATAPFEGTLLLRGCNQSQQAKFYRIHYSLNGSPAVPFLNLSWPIFRPLGSIPTWVTPDANGWYHVLPDPANWMIPYLLLAWPTGAAGIYDVFVELGDSGKNHLLQSAPVRFRVDNSSPTGLFTSLSWRPAQAGVASPSDPSWIPLPLNCPVVKRPIGQDIEFCVSYQASASHLLYSALGANGCGSASAVLSRKTDLDSIAHWHTWQGDNTVIRSAIFQLNYAADNQGAYSFSLNAWSRAFNPTDAAGYTADWNHYDVAPIGGQVAALQIAVVNQ